MYLSSLPSETLEEVWEWDGDPRFSEEMTLHDFRRSNIIHTINSTIWMP